MTKINADIDFIQMANDITKIKQAVLGNGMPGLCQRVNALEEHHKKLGYFCGFCAGVGCVCGACLTWVLSLIMKI